jgi:hypothetical protein
VLEDFVNHYDMVVIPARVAKPKDKALVENQVKLLYSRVYAKLRNLQFFDLYSLREAVTEKVRDHNQTRMQNKPYCRQERFLAEERPTLGKLPDTLFRIKSYRWYKVQKNGHVFLSQDKHYYSVPYRWTGERAFVTYTATLVTIDVRNQCVATHVRNIGPGGYTSVKEHLASNHQYWLDRSPQYYLDKAREKSSLLVRFFEGIFAGKRPPEHHYRSCDGLLRLQKNTSSDVFERALAIALENGMYSYSSMKNLIQNDAQNREKQARAKPLPEHENIRGKEYYRQLTLNFEEQ